MLRRIAWVCLDWAMKARSPRLCTWRHNSRRHCIRGWRTVGAYRKASRAPTLLLNGGTTRCASIFLLSSFHKSIFEQTRVHCTFTLLNIFSWCHWNVTAQSLCRPVLSHCHFGSARTQGVQSGIIKWTQNIMQRCGIGVSNAYRSSENYILAAPYSFRDNLKGCVRIMRTCRTRLTQISGCRFALFDSTYTFNACSCKCCRTFMRKWFS